MDGTTGNQRRASVLEIVGVWLHVWTAPRDVVIPPVPWRKLAIGTGVAVVVIGVALAVMIPRINEGKENRAAAAAAEQARAQKANRERIIRLQQPRTGSVADAQARRRRAARPSAWPRATGSSPSVETAITADAKARGAKGEMSKVQGPTTCELAAGAAVSGEVGVFDCYTVVRKVPKVEDQRRRLDRLPVPRRRALRHLHVRLLPHRAVPRRAADPGPAHRRPAPRRLPRAPKRLLNGDCPRLGELYIASTILSWLWKTSPKRWIARLAGAVARARPAGQA